MPGLVPGSAIGGTIGNVISIRARARRQYRATAKIYHLDKYYEELQDISRCDILRAA
jgi:hypothetical protein